MVSNIQPSYPVAVTPTTQSVRDNFQAAHDEITALQAAPPTLPISGGTLTGPLTLPGLRITGLPTSPAGLPPGTIWSNGGVLCVA